MIEIASCAECRDTWSWVAIYRDGSQLHECQGRPPHHVFADIDLEHLESLAWIPRERNDLPQLAVQMTEPTMRPILFRRRLIELNVASEALIGRMTIHCLGWQKNLDDGRNVQSFTFMFEDGSMLTSPDRNAV